MHVHVSLRKENLSIWRLSSCWSRSLAKLAPNWNTYIFTYISRIYKYIYIHVYVCMWYTFKCTFDAYSSHIYISHTNILSYTHICMYMWYIFTCICDTYVYTHIHVHVWGKSMGSWRLNSSCSHVLAQMLQNCYILKDKYTYVHTNRYTNIHL